MAPLQGALGLKSSGISRQVDKSTNGVSDICLTRGMLMSVYVYCNVFHHNFLLYSGG
jgi:hypothetical protein